MSNLDEVLAPWALGPALAAEPIALGIENRNFFVRFEKNPGARWVLTLRETRPPTEALRLMTALAGAGLPVPLPHPSGSQGEPFTRTREGFAWLIPAAPGRHLEVPSSEALHNLGEALGRAHLLGAPLPGRRHPRDLPWMRTIAETPTAQPYRAQLSAALAAQATWDCGAALPQGLVHGDLFRDNVLFDGVRPSGLIDFDHTARGPLLFDLAVVALDGIYLAGGPGDGVRALAEGYESSRRLSPAEAAAWPKALALAALRFALARLAVPKKDPAPLLALLEAWDEQAPTWPLRA
jgi:homoserine kinase type II